MEWDPPKDAAYPLGIQNLTFGKRTLSLVDDGAALTVTTDQPLTVIDRGTRRHVPAGTTRLPRQKTLDTAARGVLSWAAS